MFAFVTKKLLAVIPTLIGITLLAFLLIRLIPGDPIEVMAGERHLDPAVHQIEMHKLKLDLPLYQQYGSYLDQLLHGDLGNSLVSREPVIAEFLAFFPATVELSLAAMLFALALGLPAGMLAGLKRGSVLDHGVMGGALAGYSMPIFWWGLILTLFFSVHLGWTPVSGRIDIEFDVPVVTGFLLIDTLLAHDVDAFKSALMHLILPMIALGTVPLAVIARMTRSAMIEVLKEDYIRTARAKGLSTTRIVVVHGLRNALIPVITIIGLQVGSLLAGAVLTETIFSWPGIGKLLIDSIAQRDYPVVQAGILITACIIIAVNLIVDMLYGLVNPRIRGH